MSFPEDTIQLCSVIAAGIPSQVLSNFRCGLMILTNIIVLMELCLLAVSSDQRKQALHILNRLALPDSNSHGRRGAFCSKLQIEISFICSLTCLPVLFVNTIPYIMCISLVSSNIGGFTKKATCGVRYLHISGNKIE
jgi:hypothetical protein